MTANGRLWTLDELQRETGLSRWTIRRDELAGRISSNGQTHGRKRFTDAEVRRYKRWLAQPDES